MRARNQPNVLQIANESHEVDQRSHTANPTGIVQPAPRDACGDDLGKRDAPEQQEQQAGRDHPRQKTDQTLAHRPEELPRKWRSGPRQLGPERQRLRIGRATACADEPLSAGTDGSALSAGLVLDGGGVVTPLPEPIPAPLPEPLKGDALLFSGAPAPGTDVSVPVLPPVPGVGMVESAGGVPGTPVPVPGSGVPGTVVGFGLVVPGVWTSGTGVVPLPVPNGGLVVGLVVPAPPGPVSMPGVVALPVPGPDMSAGRASPEPDGRRSKKGRVFRPGWRPAPQRQAAVWPPHRHRSQQVERTAFDTSSSFIQGRIWRRFGPPTTH